MKLHKTLFCLLILFLPTQLGKHFWPDWTMVLGLRLDYLSPTLYFTDILILGILVSWLVENIIIFRHSGKRVKRAHPESDSGQARMTKVRFFLFSFLIFLLFNCFFAQNQPAAFYKFFKLVEFFLLGFYIVKNSLKISNFKFQIFVAVICSSLLATAQFINQRSLGGIFYWLGERNFNAGTPGIAQTIWNGRLLLRSYATFPHPNVLAGFLVISLLLILIKNRQITTAVLICPIILGVVALFLTFSHTAWVVFGFGVLVLVLCRHCEPEGRGNLVFKFIGLLPILFFIFYFLFSIFPIQSESITYRQDLNLAAIKEWQSSPLVGVGLNNFLVRLPEFYQSSGEIRWFQPAHNLFLMVLSETGAIGLIGAMGFLILTFRRLLLNTNYQLFEEKLCLLTTLIAILVLGFFDHYFYTLQQGQLLMTLVFGLAWSTPSKNDKITS